MAVGRFNFFFAGRSRRGSTCRYIVGQSLPLTFFRTCKTSRSLVSHVDNLGFLKSVARCTYQCEPVEHSRNVRYFRESKPFHSLLDLFQCFSLHLVQLPDLALALLPNIVLIMWKRALEREHFDNRREQQLMSERRIVSRIDFGEIFSTG